MAVKLPRTIRLDASDTFVYASAAQPGELAVPGTFMFSGFDEAALTGKDRQAFRGGFLGIDSFGWSTLVIISEISSEERSAAVNRLAAGLVRYCGAPDEETALPAAEEEIAFAESLCDQPCGTLLALLRRVEGSNVRESFRTLHRRTDQLSPAVAFELVAVEDDHGASEEVDFGELIKRLEK
jgi:Family of unknown function (DUF6505)